MLDKRLLTAAVLKASSLAALLRLELAATTAKKLRSAGAIEGVDGLMIVNFKLTMIFIYV